MTGTFRVGIEVRHHMTWVMHSLRPLLQIITKTNMM